MRPESHSRTVGDSLLEPDVLGGSALWIAGGSGVGLPGVVQAAEGGGKRRFGADAVCCRSAFAGSVDAGGLLSPGARAQMGAVGTRKARHSSVVVLLVQPVGFSVRSVGGLCKHRVVVA